MIIGIQRPIKILPLIFQKTICPKNSVKHLQELCGFDVNEDAYLFGCVSRLDNQKGFDIIIDALYQLRLQYAVCYIGQANCP